MTDKERLIDGGVLAMPAKIDERFVYPPVDFVEPDAVFGNDLLVLRGATLWLFGVLASSFHRAWTRMLAKREDGFLVYDIGRIYNNLPWPEKTPQAEERVAAAARELISTRDAFNADTLLTLYFDSSIPMAVRLAHKALDEAVLAAYGLPPDADDASIQTELMRRYAALVNQHGINNTATVGGGVNYKIYHIAA